MDSLTKISEEIANCKLCPLYKHAKNPVPGEGSPKAEILFIGEAPGATEDEQGKPFVGRAGQLLTELLSSIDIKREEVFITNVVKHRPPNNRAPAQEEVAACRNYLERQITIISPKIIVALGNHALEWLTGKTGISSSRGKIIEKEIAGKTRKILPTFHPAALIYNSSLTETAKEDFKKIKKLAEQKDLSSF